MTWPGLRNTAVLIMIIITMPAFTLYPQIAVMTTGGPLDSTQSVVFQMVERGYGKQDIAGGSTISVFLFLFVLSISLLQGFLTRERRGHWIGSEGIAWGWLNSYLVQIIPWIARALWSRPPASTEPAGFRSIFGLSCRSPARSWSG